MVIQCRAVVAPIRLLQYNKEATTMETLNVSEINRAAELQEVSLWR